MELNDLEAYRTECFEKSLTPTVFLTGQAGTGKTYAIKKAVEEDPSFAILCATTGIASVNLGTITLNSALGYFDTNSLREAYQEGYAHRKLRNFAEQYQWMVIDEVSMMPKQQLQIIHEMLSEVNEGRSDSGKAPLGLILTGDFAQLAPIPGPLYKDGKVMLQTSGKNKGEPVKEPVPWAFHSECWKAFGEHTIKLEKVWRQENPKFLEALNAIRKGAGGAGTGILKNIVEFAPGPDHRFDGTTIVSKNDEVDRANKLRLMELTGKAVELTSSRWWAGQVSGGNQPGEWKNIPEGLTVKEGALVMLLDNKYDEMRNLVYCNGDLAHIESMEFGEKIPDPIEDEFSLTEMSKDSEEPTKLICRLVRNGREVEVTKIARRIEQRSEPDEDDPRSKHPKVHPSTARTGKKCWVMGQIDFFPVRLAYATTVHKSQGLSLDRVQIDPSSYFFGNPQMVYVALSRVRTPEGLRIVGRPDALAKKVNVDPMIRGFL